MAAEDEGIITGMTLQQERQLRQLIREENSKLLQDAFSNENCPRPCRRMAGVEHDLYGPGGMKGMVTTLKTEMEDVTWYKRTAIGAAVAAAASLIVALYQVGG